MTWFRVDDAFAEHPKLESLEALGCDAWSRCLAVWIAAGCYCARHTTDGRISRARLERITPLGRLALEAADHLVAAGLWDAVEDGYVFHDWSDYQPTRAELEADRAAKTERQKRWRQRRRAEKLAPARGVDGGVDASTNASRDASRDGLRDALRDGLRDASRDGPRDASVDGRRASVASTPVDAAPSRPVPSRPVSPSESDRAPARAPLAHEPPGTPAQVWAALDVAWWKAFGARLPGLFSPLQRGDAELVLERCGGGAGVLREVEGFVAWASTQAAPPAEPWARFCRSVGTWSDRIEADGKRAKAAKRQRDAAAAERLLKPASNGVPDASETEARLAKVAPRDGEVVPIAEGVASVLSVLRGAS